MHNQSDQLAKNLMRDSLHRAAFAETEVEVLAAAQRIDIYSVPDPARDAERAEMGLLGELSARPAIFEPYRRTPTLRIVRQCLRKQLTWYHELERRTMSGNRSPPRARAGSEAEVLSGSGEDDEAEGTGVLFPSLVILSPGRPEMALDLLGFAPERAGPGVYRNSPGFEMCIVVLVELPRTRATLMLRLLGSGRVFRDALADLNALPEDAWEKSVATPLLIHFRLVTREEQAPEEDEMNAEIQAWWEEYQRNEQRLREAARNEGLQEGHQEGHKEGHEEGRREGERKLLLRLLRARFGDLPASVVARIEAAGEPDLERWGERVLHAHSLADVLADPS